MGLTYLPQSTRFDAKSKSMRFVVLDGALPVKCGVGAQAMRNLAGLPEPTPEQMRQAFMDNQARILLLIEAKYSAGDVEESGTFLVKIGDLDR